MRQSVIIHFTDGDAIVGEVEELPNPRDQFMIIHDPRRRDGRTIPNLGDRVQTVLYPWHRIHLVQVLPIADTENIIGHVRE